MEVIDEWSDAPRASGSASASEAGPGSLEAGIRERLQGFRPRILSVHCYRDLGYPWLHLVFDRTIAPEVALRAGSALAGLPGVGGIHLNSLRPRAVFFLFPPASEQQLPASRYGEALDVIRQAWQPATPAHPGATDTSDA